MDPNQPHGKPRDLGDGRPITVKPCPKCGVCPSNVDDCGEFGNADCPYFGIGQNEYSRRIAAATVMSLTTAAASGQSEREGNTSFSKLSQEAQDLIVAATLGEFDKSGPPEMSDDVKAEIAKWASEPEPAEPTPNENEWLEACYQALCVSQGQPQTPEHEANLRQYAKDIHTHCKEGIHDGWPMPTPQDAHDEELACGS